MRTCSQVEKGHTRLELTCPVVAQQRRHPPSLEVHVYIVQRHPAEAPSSTIHVGQASHADGRGGEGLAAAATAAAAAAASAVAGPEGVQGEAAGRRGEAPLLKLEHHAKQKQHGVGRGGGGRHAECRLHESVVVQWC